MDLPNMTHLTCEFCNSRIGPILPQDMGEGRVMHLCPRCRAYIREGNEAGMRQQGYPIIIEMDGRVIGKTVVSHLTNVIRNSSGKRNF